MGLDGGEGGGKGGRGAPTQYLAMKIDINIIILLIMK